MDQETKKALQEFKKGMIHAIRYYKDNDKNINFNEGYDFYEEFLEELYSHNGNNIYTQENSQFFIEDK